MIACDRFRMLFSSLLDGELEKGLSEQLREHLQACSACEQEWHAFQELHGRLREQVRLTNVHAKCARIRELAESRARTEPSTSTFSITNPAPVKFHRQVFAGLLALVACLTIVFTVPWQHRGDSVDGPVIQPVVAGHLVRATGSIDVRIPDSQAWLELSPESKRSLAPGTRLRTRADVLCEVETPDKNLVRIGQSAEVVIQDLNRVQLIKGQLWCKASPASQIELDVVSSNARESGLVAVLTCPSSTQIQCASNDSQITCQSLPGNPVTTQVNVDNTVCIVAPGEAVSIDGARSIERQSSQKESDKIWQLPLLAMDASAKGELMDVLRPVLSSVGMSKIRHMNEEQIRALGPLGAIPLLVYAESEQSSEQAELRRRAVWLASDMADARSLPWLRKLQNDSDPQLAEVVRAMVDRLKN